MAVVIPKAHKLRLLVGPAVNDISAIDNRPFLVAMEDFYNASCTFGQLSFPEQEAALTNKQKLTEYFSRKAKDENDKRPLDSKDDFEKYHSVCALCHKEGPAHTAKCKTDYSHDNATKTIDIHRAKVKKRLDEIDPLKNRTTTSTPPLTNQSSGTGINESTSELQAWPDDESDEPVQRRTDDQKRRDQQLKNRARAHFMKYVLPLLPDMKGMVRREGVCDKATKTIDILLAEVNKRLDEIDLPKNRTATATPPLTNRSSDTESDESTSKLLA
jgi:hypothetical protein